MIDNEKRNQRLAQKEKTRRRMHVSVDPDNYIYTPAIKQADYYSNEVTQRVGIYVRVSTDDVRQTTSYELQKKYYEDFVLRHPNWTLVKIYADEGISGTSLKHRDEFKQMIADARNGKLDMIITKSVSRFARNVVDFIGMVRDLAELRPPVGVFFESECVFSLNDDSQMALTFQATMAEEESHIRSRSMETSLRMRLDNGIPLTPKLLGYTHDADGNLIINPDEAPTVKLAFYMYLYGYSTQQIADAFIALGRKSYLGNIKWTSGSIVQILRNERHCGEVLTRKTYTENYRTHRTLKNRGEKPQSRYLNHHEAIVSRDDFIAVQRMLDNAKYRNKSILPQLRVIESGVFQGFVIINPRWAAFKEAEYYQAAQSVYGDQEADFVQLETSPGDFDLSGFEVARAQLFDIKHRPIVNFSSNAIRFNTECARRFGERTTAELLVNPITRQFAVRPANPENRNSVIISTFKKNTAHTKAVSSAAFGKTLYGLFGWNPDYKYRMIGSVLEQDDELAFIFDADHSEPYIKSYMLAQSDGQTVLQPLTATPNKKLIRAIPKEWTRSFGKQFYLHELSLAALENLSESDWMLRIEGQLYETGKRPKVTGFEELKQYIRTELGTIITKEEQYE